MRYNHINQYHDLGGVLGRLLPHGVEMHLGPGIGHIQQEVLGKGAVLDVGQDLLHGLLGVLGDDLGTGNIVAVLGGVGDRIPQRTSTSS